MPTAKKEANVAELKELVQKASIVIGTEYRGLSVKEITTLRRVLREAGVEARVVKNRLFQLAASQAGVAEAGQVVDGPTLVVFGFADVVTPAKAITEYARTARNAFAPKKAFMDGNVVAGTVVAELASLPSREELIAKLAGAFVSQVQQFVNLTNDSIQSFARLVDARANQIEGA
ncbi:MAG TPA: 50S ribosomal protein L10 [Dehalococcoidia bacterium]|nr:50S ribosomal protein L10 [Dehalococcoidia bacterium]